MLNTQQHDPIPAPGSTPGEAGERASAARHPRRGAPSRTDVPMSDVGSTTIRLLDGRTVTRRLSPERQRRIHLGLLHATSDGFIELTPGTRPHGG